jgi:septal ring factor EnvC (AmiA/AmiB activator)
MKLLILTMFLIPTLTLANTSQVLEAEAINVDGYLSSAPQDKELETIQSEIKKQKEEIILNRQKAKGFQELTKSVEKLSETTEEYLEERKAAQLEIANYNAKVKCLQAEAPGPECDKYIRRRR